MAIYKISQKPLKKYVQEAVKSSYHDFELPKKFEAESLKKVWLGTIGMIAGILAFIVIILIWKQAWVISVVVLVTIIPLIIGVHNESAKKAVSGESIELTAKKISIYQNDQLKESEFIDSLEVEELIFQNLEVRHASGIKVNETPILYGIVFKSPNGKRLTASASLNNGGRLMGTLLRKMLDNRKIDIS